MVSVEGDSQVRGCGTLDGKCRGTTVNSMDVGHWMVSVCDKAMEARTLDGKCRGMKVNSMVVGHRMVSVEGRQSTPWMKDIGW